MQTSSKFYLVVMVCLHLQLLCSGAILTGHCPPKCICPLSSAVSKQEINCAANGFNLEVRTTYSHLLVHCSVIDHANNFDDISWNLRDFISSGVKLSKLTLQRCAIPANRSLTDLLSPFLTPADAAKLSTVYFVGNHQNSYSAALSPKLFEGLSTLNTLSLKNATGVPIVTNDLLAFVPGLQWLDVREYSHPLPTELLKRVPTLTTLELGHDPLLSEALAAGFLSHLDSIHTLMIKSCSLDHIPSLSHLQRLKLIDINANHGLQLTSGDAFANLTKLTSLTLKNNHLKELPHNLFHTNTAIESLDLSLNRLVELPPDLFNNQTSLKVLSLQGNQLKGELPNQLFLQTKNLEKLDLSENALETINRELFGNLLNLEHLVLSNNRIRMIHPDAFKIDPNRSPKITELQLAHNKITLEEPGQGPFYGLDKLRVLDLSYNLIRLATRVQYTNAMRGLEILNLSHNNIANISYADLMFVSKQMLKFSLSANAIDMIDFSDETETGNLPKEVMLNGDTLRCDCHIYHFVRYIQNKNKQRLTLHTDRLKCANSSDDLSDMKVQEIDRNKLVCSIAGKMCPNKCICTSRPEDEYVIIDCARRGITSVPAIPPPEEFNSSYIELRLEHNQLETLRAPTNSSGWHSVRRLIASNNQLKALNANDLPKHLILLDISNNTIEQLDDSATKSLATIKQLLLSGNAWYCSCDAEEFVEFAHDNRPRIGDFDALKCHDGNRLEETTVNTICRKQTILTVVGCIVLALIGLFCGLATWFYYKYKIEIKVWLFKHNLCHWLTYEEDDDERDACKRYDAFVSYSHQEESFVAKDLIPGLEKERNFKLCWHQRDFIPGALISTQITKAIEESRRTIVVLSKSYLSSVWGQQEFRTAFQQSVSEKRNRVVAIIYEDIGNVDNLDADLRAYLRSTTYLQWGDTWFWDKLAYAMPHPRMGQTEQSGHQLAQNLQQATVGRTKILNNGQVVPDDKDCDYDNPCLQLPVYTISDGLDR